MNDRETHSTMHTTKNQIGRRWARRGMALYMTVMSTALVVSLLGLAGLAVVRIERERAQMTGDLAAARVNARSAVEYALRVLADDPNWRTTYSNGVETTPVAAGPQATGTISFVLEDVDGSLSLPDTDLRLKGVGRAGNVIHVSSVQIVENLAPTDYLRTVIHTGGQLTLTDRARAVGGPYSSNMNLDIRNPRRLEGDAEAPAYTGDINQLSGTFTAGPPKSMPPDSVFDSVYRPLATEIFWTDLVRQGAFRHLSGGLNPTSNPYGAPNPLGIYYLHVPDSGKLKFVRLRLQGTLLIEAEASALINGVTVNQMEPDDPRYAVLLVKANGPGVKTNLQGLRRVTTHGLFHFLGRADQTVTLGSRFRHVGTIVVAGEATVGALRRVTLTHDPAIESSPPLGYDLSSSQGVTAIPGSWRRELAP